MNVPSTDKHLVVTAFKAIEGIGIDVSQVCRAYNLEDPREYAGRRVPLAMIAPLMDAIGEYTKDPEYVYHAVPSISPEQLGTLFNIAKFCQSVFDVMRMVCRYSNIISEVISFSVRENRAGIDLVATPNREVYVSAYQIEGILYSSTTQYRALAKLRWFDPDVGPLVREVFFAHGPRFPESNYAEYFGCPVHFECEFSGLRLNHRVLALSLGAADERMVDYFRSVAERYEVTVAADDSMIRRVQRAFIQRMVFGEPDRREVARALSLSVRTMQRKLAAEGCSYWEAVEEARQAVAKQELKASGLAVQDISFMLGYSSERSFRRAFRRWTGMSPKAYRDGDGLAG